MVRGIDFLGKIERKKERKKGVERDAKECWSTLEEWEGREGGGRDAWKNFLS